MSLLTDRASILREYFRLVDADSTDEDMIEHDSTTLEGAYEALDVGAARAQLYLIGIGQGAIWLTTGSTLTVTGSDPDRYSSLPSEFLRLDSDPDQGKSGLTYPSGLEWGREIHPDDQRKVTGNYYWVEYEATPATSVHRVRYARGAAVPSSLVPKYYRRMDVLVDSTAAEMRADDRNLIPAYAADYAANQAWFAGGGEQKQAIRDHLAGCQREAFRRGRLTRRARKVRGHQPTGHWIV